MKGLPEKIKELLANEQDLTDAEIDALLADYGEEITDEEPKQQEPQEPAKDADLVKMAQDDFYNDPIDNSFFG